MLTRLGSCRAEGVDVSSIPSISSLSTEEWRRLYEREGRVDLWLEDEFNAGSRLIVSPQHNCLSIVKSRMDTPACQPAISGACMGDAVFLRSTVLPHAVMGTPRWPALNVPQTIGVESFRCVLPNQLLLRKQSTDKLLQKSS